MDPTAIRDQIDRILRSQSFASKSQLRKMLEILFKHMDSQTTLKPDHVIKELWSEETRTKRPADVATEMNRLRHALESYYNGEGKSDPIIISLPNRAAPAPDGTHETRWIVALPRDVEGPPPGSRVGSRRRVKVLGAIGAVEQELSWRIRHRLVLPEGTGVTYLVRGFGGERPCQRPFRLFGRP
jgi:hypothetical protein